MQKLDRPAILKPFYKGQSSNSLTQTAVPKCLSKRRIPFTFANTSISLVLQLPFTERFQVREGICNLDMDPGICELCSSSSWHTKETPIKIITSNQVLTSKSQHINNLLRSLIISRTIVYEYKCASENCNGKCQFDGQSMGLICMNTFCIAYEVLRHHMYQFLHGRYVINSHTTRILILYGKTMQPHLPVKDFLTEMVLGYVICSITITCNFLLFRTTIFTEFTVLCHNHEDFGHDLTSYLSYQQYLGSWYSFVHLLDINYSEGFTCKLVNVHVMYVMATFVCMHEVLAFSRFGTPNFSINFLQSS